MEERIAAYLHHRMPSARQVRVSRLRRIPGGASRETWSFDAAWNEDGDAQQGGFIVRRDPDASLLETDRGREFAIYRALERTPVPAPRALWLEEDTRWLERPFFVMERIDGCETSGNVLTSAEYEMARPTIARRKIQVLAQIHAQDWRSLGLALLGEPATPAACAPRELAHWRETVRAETTEPQPALEAAMGWLAAHLPPPPERVVLVHGDYRTGNFLFDKCGEIRGILDWEMAHLGDPLEDVAWLCQKSWRFRHAHLAGGLLTRTEVYQLYEEFSGRPVDEDAVRWWEILANVKLAAIYLTGARSFVDGRTSEILMAVVGRMLPPLEMEILDLLSW